MSIREHITDTLGATHLFMLDDDSRDPDSSGDSTGFTAGSGGEFCATPVCYGVNNAFCSNTVDTFSGAQRGGLIGSTNDINLQANNFSERTINVWASISDVSVPSCIYEQGGNTNNYAINSGIGRTITFQAAVGLEQFLIVQTNFLITANRRYMITAQWQHHSRHSGAGNRVRLYVNGIVQVQYGEDWLEATSAFSVSPMHGADVAVGNTGDRLKTYNGSTQRFVPRAKTINMLSMHNDTVFDKPQTRELFERTVLPEAVILADTVINQQAALDVLSGSTYEGVNCAIQIRQATDATDYLLELDNITFARDDKLKDISVQFVGTGTLTLRNINGSNATDVSTPPEVDLDGTNILVGGGSIVVQNTYVLTIDTLLVGGLLLIFDGVGDQDNHLGTELHRTNSTGTSVDYSFNDLQVGDTVTVRHDVTGYKSYVVEIALAAQNATFSVRLISETN